MWVIKHVDLLALHCSKCKNETPWFGHVGCTCGSTRLEPELLDHAFAFLRLVFVEIDNFDEMMVNLGWSKVWICWFYIVPSAKMKRHDLAMLVVHLEAPKWSPSCWITRFHVCVLLLPELMRLLRYRPVLGDQACGCVDLTLYRVQN